MPWAQIGDNLIGEFSGDKFGGSISLSDDGSIIAIGAPDNDGNGKESGHVRVFKNIDNIWTQIGEDIDGEAAYDNSGSSINLSSDGSYVSISAPRNDSIATTRLWVNGGYGHVRVFKNIDNTWAQIGEDIDGEARGNLSGVHSLSDDGSIIAIGSGSNSEKARLAGHVRVFKNIDNAWIQIGEDIDGEAAGDRSGSSVSISGDGSIVAIGAPWNNGGGKQSGHIRIYKNTEGTWTQIGNDIDGESSPDAPDNLGSTVCLSNDGSIVAIGSFDLGDDSPDLIEERDLKSRVKVYKNNSGIWEQIGRDIEGEANDDRSGMSISLSSDGSLLAIGAPYNDDGSGSASGHARIYKNIDNNWIQIIPDIDGNANSDYLGTVSVSGDGNLVAIGAQQYDPRDDAISKNGYVKVIQILENTVGEAYNLKNIRDYDGNLHGSTGSVFDTIKTSYKYQGLLDVNADSINEAIYTNKESGRWVTASVNSVTEQIDYSDYGSSGTTRVVGIYIDPLVRSGDVEAGSEHDSQRRFQNDLEIDNLIAKTSGDYDGDGFQEVYWKTNDGTAYLRALMHADGNIQYANYQSEEQMS